MSKFWMVYGIGRGAPTRQHTTKESAQKEAGRLALQHPGSTFVVLKAMKGYRADIPKIAEFKLSDTDFEDFNVVDGPAW